MIPLHQQADAFVAKMLALELPASNACYKSYVAGWKAAVDECAATVERLHHLYESTSADPHNAIVASVLRVAGRSIRAMVS